MKEYVGEKQRQACAMRAQRPIEGAWFTENVDSQLKFQLHGESQFQGVSRVLKPWDQCTGDRLPLTHG